MGCVRVRSGKGVVEAAVHGRVLIIDGLERAERNVLPILNNLLENREMQLDDGRFLVAPQRFAALKRESQAATLKQLNLVAVHPNFRVVRRLCPLPPLMCFFRSDREHLLLTRRPPQICIGLPVPPFAGNPLDPPLRSRLQARRVDHISTAALIRTIALERADRSLTPAPPSALPTAPSALCPALRLLVTVQASLRALGQKQSGNAASICRLYLMIRIITSPGFVCCLRALWSRAP